MKIERTDNLHPLMPGATKPAPEPAGTRFQDVLRDAVSAAPGLTVPGAIGNLPSAGAGMGLVAVGGRGELLSRADELIGLLEFLQGGISGSGLPVKDACASVRAIEDGADALAHLVERLPEGDPFRDIMNRIVITASVEAIKFRRGDYQ